MILHRLSDHTKYNYTTAVAGGALSALKVVVVSTTTTKAVYASRTTANHSNRSLGLTTHAAASNTNVTILTEGEWSDAGWAWNVNSPIFLNTNGDMTQVSPASGFVTIVARPVTATKIVFGLHQAIKLA